MARSYLAAPQKKKVILHPNAPPLQNSYHPTNLKSIILKVLSPCSCLEHET